MSYSNSGTLVCVSNKAVTYRLPIQLDLLGMWRSSLMHLSPVIPQETPGCHDHAWLWCLFGFLVLGGAEQVFQEARGGVWLTSAVRPVPHLPSSRRLLKDLQDHYYSGTAAGFCSSCLKPSFVYLLCLPVFPVPLPSLLTSLWIP